MEIIRKKSFADLENVLFIETGLILAMMAMLLLFKLNIHKGKGGGSVAAPEQETVKMEDINITKQAEVPPAPPVPAVPVEVPNDEIVEDEPLNINSELNLDEPLAIPPPPKAVKKEKDEDFFVVVEDMPVLIGGLESLQKLIRYPKAALSAGIQGRVIIQFIVNEKGQVENPQVVRGIGGGCDEEAIRAVSLAHFKPGMQRGKPVRVQYNLPVIFRLTS